MCKTKKKTRFDVSVRLLSNEKKMTHKEQSLIRH